MRKKPDFFSKKFLKYVFAVLGLLAALIANGINKPEYRQGIVVKVYDGDTFVLSDGEKVRLIGIDTPEAFESQKLFSDARKSGQDIAVIKAMGKRAHEFTSSWVLGQTVRLELGREKRDRYGRLLAYVYMPFPHPPLSKLPRSGYIVNLDGKKWYFVNATIVQAGYAKPMTIAPNDKYQEIFEALYDQARGAGLGLWNKKSVTVPAGRNRSGLTAVKAH